MLVSELRIAVADNDIAIDERVGIRGGHRGGADRCLLSGGNADIPFQGRHDHFFNCATHSISINIFGSGSAATTQVVRAGYGAGPNADAYSTFIAATSEARVNCTLTLTRSRNVAPALVEHALDVGDDKAELGLEVFGQRAAGVEAGNARDEQQIAGARGKG